MNLHGFYSFNLIASILEIQYDIDISSSTLIFIIEPNFCQGCIMGSCWEKMSPASKASVKHCLSWAPANDLVRIARGPICVIFEEHAVRRKRKLSPSQKNVILGGAPAPIFVVLEEHAVRRRISSGLFEAIPEHTGVFFFCGVLGRRALYMAANNLHRPLRVRVAAQLYRHIPYGAEWWRLSCWE